MVDYNPATESMNSLYQDIQLALGDSKASSLNFVTADNHSSGFQLVSATTISSTDTSASFWTGLSSVMTDSGRITISGDSSLLSTDATISGRISELSGHSSSFLDAYDTAHLSTDTANTTTGLDVYFIDSSVKDVSDILSALPSNATVVYLSSNGDGVAEITSYLDGKTNISSINIITHGNDGYIVLGSDILSDSSLSSTYKDAVASWGSSMTSGASINIYSCDTAETDAGKTFVTDLSTVTGVNVSASTDLTGKSGDWTLEYSTITHAETSLAIAHYDYDLSNYDVSSADDSGEHTLRYAIENNYDNITFSVSEVDLTSGAISVSENVTLNGGAGVTITSANGEIFAVNDTYTLSVSGSLTLDGSSGVNVVTLGSASAIDIANAATLTINGGDISGTGSITNTAGSGTLAFTGAVADNVTTTVANLDISAASAIAGSATVSGTLTLNSADLTISDTGSLTLENTASANLTNSSVIGNGSNAALTDNTTNGGLKLNGSFGAITINTTGTETLSDNLTVKDLTLTAGTIALNTNILAVTSSLSGTGTANSIINCGATGYIDISSASVTLGAVSIQNASSNAIIVESGNTLSITSDTTVSGGISAAGNLDIASGVTLTLTGGTLSGAGTITNTAGSGTLAFTGAVTDAVSTDIYDLDIESNSTITGNVSVNHNLTLNANLTVNGSGDLSVDGAAAGAGILKYVVTNEADSGNGSLRYALTHDISTSSSGIYYQDVSFTESVSSISLTGGTISLAHSVSVYDNSITITNSPSSIFSISGGTIALSGLTFSNSAASAIVDSGSTSLTITDSNFSGNNSAGNGAAIKYTSTGTLNLNNDTFSGNVATGNGGALYFNSTGTLNINGGSFSGANSAANGAAIYIGPSVGTINLYGGVSLANSTYVSDSNTLSITGNTTFASNIYLGSGAAIDIGGGKTLFLSSGKVSGTGSITNTAGTGTLDFTGTAEDNVATNVSVIKIDSGAATSIISAAATVTGTLYQTSGTLSLSDTADLTIAATASISGSGASVAGNGTNAVLTDNSTNGGLRVSGTFGTLTINANGTDVLTNVTSAETLNVYASSTLDVSGKNLTVNGNITDNGIIDVNGGTLTAKGNISGTGSIADTAGTGTLVLANSGTLSVTTSVHNLTVNGNEILDTDLTVAGELNQTNGYLSISGAHTLTLTGTASGTGAYISGGGSGKLISSASGARIAGTFDTVTITAATTTLADTTEINNLTMAAGAGTLELNAKTLTLDNTSSLANGSSINVSNGSTLILAGNTGWSLTGAGSISGAGTLEFAGVTNAVIDLVTTTVNNITVSGLGELGVSAEATGILALSSGILTVRNNTTLTLSGTITGGTGIITGAGATAGLVDKTTTGGASIQGTFGTLTINNTQHTDTLSANLTLNSLALTSGTLNLNGHILYVNTGISGTSAALSIIDCATTGYVDVNSAAVSMGNIAIQNSSGNSLVLDPSSVLSINANTSISDGIKASSGSASIQIANGVILTYSSGTVDSSVSISGDGTLKLGDASIVQSSSLTVANLTVAGAATLDTSLALSGLLSLNSGSLTLADSRSLTLNGTISGTGASVIGNGNNAVLIDNSSTGALRLSGAFSSLTLNTNGTDKLTGDTHLNSGLADTSLTVTKGTLNLNGYNLYIANGIATGAGAGTISIAAASTLYMTGGDITGSGTLTGTGTLRFDAASTDHISTSVSNVTVNANVEFDGTTVAAGAFTINTGTVTIGSGASLKLDGSISAAAAANTIIGTDATSTFTDNASGNAYMQGTFGTLTVNYDGKTDKLTANTTVSTLSVKAGTLNLNGYDLTVSGTTTLSSTNASISVAAASTFKAGGNISGAGTISGTGTLEFDAALTDSAVTSMSNITVAAGAGHTVTLGTSTTISGLLKLTSGSLTVGNNFTLSLTGTISGSGASIVGGGTSAVLSDTTSTGGALIEGTFATVTINNTQHTDTLSANLTVASLILTDSTLTLNGKVLTASTAITGTTKSLSIINCTSDGYIASSGSLAITNVTIQNATASAVKVTGSNSISVSNSLFKNNTGVNGAAINFSSTGTLTLSNDTFYNNIATGLGGAVYVENSSSATFTSNTFDDSSSLGNSAARGGAIYITSSTASFTGTNEFSYNTASAFGGAIYIGGTSSVGAISASFTSNSVTAGSGGAIYITDSASTGNISGTYTSNTASVSGGALYVTGTASTGTIGATFTSNTATAGSGGALYLGGTSSIGTVNAAFTSNHANAGSGGAIYDASAGASFTISSSASFNGNTASEGGAIGVNSSGTSVTISGASFYTTAYNTATNGAVIAVYDSSDLTVSGVTFSGNTVATNGGVIYMTGGSLTLTNDTFTNNTASANGGALYVSGNSTVAITGSTVFGTAGNGNSANLGGAIYNTAGTSSDSYGVYVRTTSANNFVGNHAASGGAIYNTGRLVLGDSVTSTIVISANYAADAGGAIYNTGILKFGSGSVWSTININNNYTSALNSTGGAVYNSGTASVNNYVILNLNNNYTYDTLGTSGYGGAIYNAAGSFTMGSYNSTIRVYSNTSYDGGAIYIKSGSSFNITGSYPTTDYIYSNTAGAYGGAIYDGGTLTVTSTYSNIAGTYPTKIYNNTAVTAGAGIYVDAGGIANINGLLSLEDNNFDIAGTATINATGNLLVHDSGPYISGAGSFEGTSGGALTIAGSLSSYTLPTTFDTIGDLTINTSTNVTTSAATDLTVYGTLSLYRYNGDVLTNLISHINLGNTNSASLAIIDSGFNGATLDLSSFKSIHNYTLVNFTLNNDSEVTFYSADPSKYLLVSGTMTLYLNAVVVDPLLGKIDLGTSSDPATLKLYGSSYAYWSKNSAHPQDTFELSAFHSIAGHITTEAVTLDNLTVGTEDPSTDVGIVTYGYSVYVTNNLTIYLGKSKIDGLLSEVILGTDSTPGSIYLYGSAATYASEIGRTSFDLARIGTIASNTVNDLYINVDDGVLISTNDVTVNHLLTVYMTSNDRSDLMSHVTLGSTADGAAAGNLSLYYKSSANHVFDYNELDSITNSAIYDLLIANSTGQVIFYLDSNDLTIKNSISGYSSGNAVIDCGSSAAHGAGSLIVSSGSVTFSNITVRNSTDSAVHVTAGNLTVNSSAFSSNSGSEGAAIDFTSATGALSTNNVTFSNNTASTGNGGAIYFNSTGRILIANSTFTSNKADNGLGGAIYIAKAASDSYISSGTFTSNEASEGGVVYLDSNVTDFKILTATFGTAGGNSAIAGNGGVVYSKQSGTLTIQGSTFENNTASSLGGVIYLQSGTLAVSDYSNAHTSFINNSALSGGAIYLDSSTGASVISGGVFRGNQATNGSGGAIFATGTSLTVKGGSYGSSGSANTATINGGAIYLNSGTLTVTSYTDYNSVVQTSSFTYNTASGDGGAIYLKAGTGTVSITGATFNHNTAGDQGGSIYAESSELDVYGATFGTSSNAAVYGGGIYVNSATLTINSATIDGTLTYTSFSSITVTGSGAAVYIDSGNTNADIYDAQFTSDTAAQNGGAIYSKSADLALYAATFTGNHATNGSGAAVYVENGAFTITNDGSSLSTVSGSVSYGDGGAIYLKSGSGTAIINNVAFTSNSSSHGNGGAIYSDASSLKIYDGSFGASGTGNSALNGGAIYLASGTLTVNTAGSTTFTSNSATSGSGGAIYIASGSNASGITNSTFTNNSATALGGAIYDAASTILTVTDGSFTGNGSEAVYLTANAKVTFAGSDNYIYDGIDTAAASSAITISGTLYISGANITGIGTVSGAAGTLVFTGAATTDELSTNIGNLVVSTTGNATIKSSVTASNSLTLTSGTLAIANGASLTLYGNITGSGAVITGAGTATLTDKAAGNIGSISGTFSTVVIDKTNGSALINPNVGTDTFTGSNFNVGVLTLTSGTIINNASAAFTISSELDLKLSYAVISDTSRNLTLGATGNYGSFYLTGIGDFSPTTSKISIADQTINNFYVDMVEPGSSVTLSSAWTIIGNVSLSSGVVYISDTAGSSLTLASTATVLTSDATIEGKGENAVFKDYSTGNLTSLTGEFGTILIDKVSGYDGTTGTAKVDTQLTITDATDSLHIGTGTFTLGSEAAFSGSGYITGGGISSNFIDNSLNSLSTITGTFGDITISGKGGGTDSFALTTEIHGTLALDTYSVHIKSDSGLLTLDSTANVTGTGYIIGDGVNSNITDNISGDAKNAVQLNGSFGTVTLSGKSAATPSDIFRGTTSIATLLNLGSNNVSLGSDVGGLLTLASGADVSNSTGWIVGQGINSNITDNISGLAKNAVKLSGSFGTVTLSGKSAATTADIFNGSSSVATLLDIGSNNVKIASDSGLLTLSATADMSAGTGWIVGLGSNANLTDNISGAAKHTVNLSGTFGNLTLSGKSAATTADIFHDISEIDGTLAIGTNNVKIASEQNGLLTLANALTGTGNIVGLGIYSSFKDATSTASNVSLQGTFGDIRIDSTKNTGGSAAFTADSEVAGGFYLAHDVSIASGKTLTLDTLATASSTGGYLKGVGTASLIDYSGNDIAYLTGSFSNVNVASKSGGTDTFNLTSTISGTLTLTAKSVHIADNSTLTLSSGSLVSATTGTITGDGSHSNFVDYVTATSVHLSGSFGNVDLHNKSSGIDDFNSSSTIYGILTLGARSVSIASNSTLTFESAATVSGGGLISGANTDSNFTDKSGGSISILNGKFGTVTLNKSAGIDTFNGTSSIQSLILNTNSINIASDGGSLTVNSSITGTGSVIGLGSNSNFTDKTTDSTVYLTGSFYKVLLNEKSGGSEVFSSTSHIYNTLNLGANSITIANDSGMFILESGSFSTTGGTITGSGSGSNITDNITGTVALSGTFGSVYVNGKASGIDTFSGTSVISTALTLGSKSIMVNDGATLTIHDNTAVSSDTGSVKGGGSTAVLNDYTFRSLNLTGTFGDVSVSNKASAANDIFISTSTLNGALTLGSRSVSIATDATLSLNSGASLSSSGGYLTGVGSAALNDSSSNSIAYLTGSFGAVTLSKSSGSDTFNSTSTINGALTLGSSNINIASDAGLFTLAATASVHSGDSGKIIGLDTGSNFKDLQTSNANISGTFGTVTITKNSGKDIVYGTSSLITALSLTKGELNVASGASLTLQSTVSTASATLATISGADNTSNLTDNASGNVASITGTFDTLSVNKTVAGNNTDTIMGSVSAKTLALNNGIITVGAAHSLTVQTSASLGTSTTINVTNTAALTLNGSVSTADTTALISGGGSSADFYDNASGTIRGISGTFGDLTIAAAGTVTIDAATYVNDLFTINGEIIVQTGTSLYLTQTATSSGTGIITGEGTALFSDRSSGNLSSIRGSFDSFTINKTVAGSDIDTITGTDTQISDFVLTAGTLKIATTGKLTLNDTISYTAGSVQGVGNANFVDNASGNLASISGSFDSFTLNKTVAGSDIDTITGTDTQISDFVLTAGTLKIATTGKLTLNDTISYTAGSVQGVGNANFVDNASGNLASITGSFDSFTLNKTVAGNNIDTITGTDTQISDFVLTAGTLKIATTGKLTLNDTISYTAGSVQGVGNANFVDNASGNLASITGSFDSFTINKTVAGSDIDTITGTDTQISDFVLTAGTLKIATTGKLTLNDTVSYTAGSVQGVGNANFVDNASGNLASITGSFDSFTLNKTVAGSDIDTITGTDTQISDFVLTAGTLKIATTGKLTVNDTISYTAGSVQGVGNANFVDNASGNLASITGSFGSFTLNKTVAGSNIDTVTGSTTTISALDLTSGTLKIADNAKLTLSTTVSTGIAGTAAIRGGGNLAVFEDDATGNIASIVGTFDHITINKTGTDTITDALNAKQLTLTAGTLNIATGYSLTVATSSSLADATVINIADTATLTLNGTVTSGANGTGLIRGNGNSADFYDNASGTISGITGTFGDLTVSTNSTVMVDGATDVHGQFTIDGNLTIRTGTSFALVLNSTSSGSGTITGVGTAGFSDRSTGNLNSITGNFGSFTINKTTAGSNVDTITGVSSIADLTLTAGRLTVAANAKLTINSTITYTAGTIYGADATAQLIENASGDTHAIRGTFDDVKLSGSADAILSGNLTTNTIELASGIDLYLNGNVLTLNTSATGAGSGVSTIHAGTSLAAGSGYVSISSGSVTISSLAVKEALVSAIQVSGSGSLSMSNSTVSVDSANVSNGGALNFSSTGTLTLNTDTFDSGAHGDKGGILYINATSAGAAANVTITNSNFSTGLGGSHALNGGAIYVNAGRVSISGGTFSSNAATENGGAIYILSGTMTISSATFSSNSADIGGAVCIAGGTVTLSGDSYNNNTASSSGGAIAIYVNSSNADVTVQGSSSFSGNTAENGNEIYLGHETADATTGKLTLNGSLGSSVTVYADSGKLSLVDNVSNDVHISGTIGSLTINNTNANIYLDSNLTITDSVTLDLGYIWLGSNNLIFEDVATCTGGSQSSMIVVDGTGDVLKYFTSENESFNFQIGTVSGSTYAYTPISITFTAASFNAGAYLDVRVDAAKETHIPGGYYYINRYWTVATNGISAYNTNVSATYVAADVKGTESICKPNVYSGANWLTFGSIASHIITGQLSTFGRITAFGAPPVNPNPPTPPLPNPPAPPIQDLVLTEETNNLIDTSIDVADRDFYARASDPIPGLEVPLIASSLDSIGDGEYAASFINRSGISIGSGVSITSSSYSREVKIGNIKDGENAATHNHAGHGQDYISDGEHGVSLSADGTGHDKWHISWPSDSETQDINSFLRGLDKHMAFKSKTEILLDEFIAI